ncbi:class I SAM-dependent methyltransferase [Microbacterium invictum]|uniref:Methyltransferase domain-containing protein n=1 Tax=Microbacterium invictum TaxID=515415 RepID=A0ABZ0VD06_9MICO|nr:methyltransferase domain-containing protein [Microbacterium invictum]WQB71271.1 methyltransferase domain-containing protein [Microbacterium invictum]
MDPALTARTRLLYETVADSYARLVAYDRFEPQIDRAMIVDFVERLSDGEPSVTILDAGCGTGRLIGLLRSLNPRVSPVGVDLSPAMLEHARAAHPDVQFIEADCSALPLPDGALDGILAWYSIIHTPPADLADLFREFRRVLREGGLVLLGFQSGSGERRRPRAYGHDVDLLAYLHDTSTVAGALRAVGFSIDISLDRGPRRREKLPQGFVLAQVEP